MNDIFLAVAVMAWCIIGGAIEGSISSKVGGDGIFVMTPADFYNNTPMNWFGSIFCYMLILVISPFWTVIKILLGLVAILYLGVKWLFTVGKKEANEDD